MKDRHDEPKAPDGREQDAELGCARVLADYVDLTAQGEQVGLDAFLARYPDYGQWVVDELRTFERLRFAIDGEELGREFGDYRLVRRLPGGGMAVVYEAVQTSLDRAVALKVLPPGLVGDARAVTRFQREARVVARLNHPQIVKVYDFGVAAGTPYFAMEFIAGETLQTLIDGLRDGRGPGGAHPVLGGSSVSAPLLGGGDDDTIVADPTASPALDRGLDDGRGRSIRVVGLPDRPACLRIAERFAQVADGLQYAHSSRIYHRDIKPSNLILDERGSIRILDFGLAWVEDNEQLTRSKDRVGTAAYMSPEQVRRGRDSVGPGGDIFSLGVTLYEMLGLERPFDARQGHELIQQILHREPRSLRRHNPQVPRDLETVVLHCLRKSARDRYQSAEGLALDLRRVARGDPLEVARRPSGVQRVARRVWGRRRLVLEGVLLAVAIVAAAWFGVVEPSLRRQTERLAAHREKVRRAAATILLPGRLLPIVQRPSFEHGVTESRDGSTEVDEQDVFAWHDPDSDVAFVADRWAFETVADAAPSIEAAVDLLQTAVAEFEADVEGRYYLAQGLVLLHREEAAVKQLQAIRRRHDGFVPALTLLESLLSEDDPERLAVTEALATVRGEGVDSWIAALDASANGNWLRAAELLEDLLDTEIGRSARTDVLLRAASARLYAGAPDLALSYVRDAWRGVAGRRFDEALFHGSVLLARGASRQAADIFSRLGETESLTDEQRERIADTFASAGQYKQAAHWLRRLVTKKGHHYRKLARMLILGSEGDMAADTAAVSKAIEDAKAIEPGNFENVLVAGEALESRGEFEQALERYTEARDMAPDEAAPRVAIAICHDAMGETAKAEGNLREAVEQTTSGLWLAEFHLARLLSRSNEHENRSERESRIEEAERLYRGLAESRPDNPLVLNNLAVLLDRHDDLAGAIEYYRRARNAAPLVGVTHYNWAWALQRQQRFGEAIPAYDAAEKYGLVDFAELYAKRGACLSNEGQKYDAQGDMDAAERRGVAETIVCRFRALRLFHSESPEEAAEAPAEFAKLIELGEGDTADHHWWRGRALANTGEPAAAVAEFDDALALDPSYGRGANALATTLLRAPGAVDPGPDEWRKRIRQLERASFGQGRAAREVLERFREELLPELASCASVDWAAERPEVLVDRDAVWRHAPYVDGYSDGAWTRLDFDHDAWAQGRGPFGYGGGEEFTTPLPDMKGQYASICLAHRFVVPAEGATEDIERLVLSIRLDDGFVAYLNGEEVARFRAGEQHTPLDASRLAEDYEGEPWMAYDVEIDPGAVRPGENLLAIRVLNSELEGRDLAAQAVLAAYRRGVDSRERRVLELSAAIGRGGDLDAATVDAYVRARIAVLRDDLEGAATLLHSILDAVAKAPAEVSLLLADCLTKKNAPADAEAVLRDACEAHAEDRRVWEAWLRVGFVDLELPASELLALLPGEPEGEEERGDRRADALWLLGELASPRPLRILAGGNDWLSPAGERWSRDRFYLGGYAYYLAGVHERVESVVYQTERWYDDGGPVIPGYRIPLPPGDYHVTLHFLEGYHSEPGKRVFDVLLEGQTFAELDRYDPIRDAGRHLPDTRSVDVHVGDGALDLEFRRRINLPKVNGIEIVSLERRRDAAHETSSERE